MGYNYYYKVDKVYFCCKKDETAAAGDSHAYKYYGWYSPSYADENNPYILAENGKTATHYISDAEYKLTPGTGNYDFVPDDTAPEQTVEVDHMYYQGGYTNHDWFKQYVFHLEPGEEKVIDFVLTPQELGLWNKDNHFVVEPGTFAVMVGSSSQDIKLQGKFEVK